MNYTGSKKLIADRIINVIQENTNITEKTYFVDLFCGGANLIEKVPLKNRIANDINKYAIAYLKKIQKDISWIPKDSTEFNLTKDKYKFIKNNRDLFTDYFQGYVGFNLSFNGIFFQGYKQNTSRVDYVKTAYNNAIKQSEKIQGVKFYSRDYRDVPIPPESIVYCDIPYCDTTINYNTEFNYEEFFEYCKYLKQQGHTIFLSEYGNTPKYFKEIASFELSSRMLNCTCRRGNNNLMGTTL